MHVTRKISDSSLFQRTFSTAKTTPVNHNEFMINLKLVTITSSFRKCMSLDNKKVNLVLADCDDNNKNQFWRWDSEGMISPKFKEDNVVHIQIKHKNNVSLAKRINPYILKNFHLSQV